MKGFIALAGFFGCAFAAFSQPIITGQPQALRVNAGSTARFSVNATDSAGAVTFQWQRNGVSLSDGGTVSGSAASNLVINPVALGDSATYTVVVSASDGSTTSSPAALTVLQGTIVDFQISGFVGGTSNLVIELFDNDKPATVQNFIHYITSGAYTNMFFDRLIPNFVIQGGDWSTSNRTSVTPGPALIDNGIFDFYVTQGAVTNPSLPSQVASEFATGPFISNLYGTLAMALIPNEPDSASSAFFINLADNPNLDTQTGGYTVFGRVMNTGALSIGGVSFANAGTNLLNYFNNANYFTKPASGIFDGSGTQNLTQFSDLPVNYDGTTEPADDNLFYVGFTFLTNSASGLAGPATPSVDTVPPTASITYPAANLLLTNGASLVLQGIASDNAGLAMVTGTLIPLNGANHGSPFGAAATGTTNWSVNIGQLSRPFGGIPVGAYNAQAIAQDGAGNPSAPALVPFVITAILTNGYGGVSIENPFTGQTITNGVGAALEDGIEYVATETAGPGQVFLNWTGLTNLSIAPSASFIMSSNFLLTANFVPNNFPGTVAFTYPPANAQLTNNNFNISGTLSGIGSAQLVLQLYSFATGNAVSQPFTNAASSEWSVPVTNLAAVEPGEYIIQVVASDAQGRSTIVSENFTLTSAGLLPVITSEPPNFTVNAGSTAIFSVGVADTNGPVSYQWQFNGVNLTDGGDIAGSGSSNLFVSPAALSDAGSYSVTVYSQFGLVSSQPALLTVAQGTIVNFQVSGFPGGPSNVVVELFDQDKPATVENFIHYITSGAYQNMFFERLVPGFVLQGGDWSTLDRTNTKALSLLGSGIYNYYVTDQRVFSPPLPQQVDNEFRHGPYIPNSYGTLAMALQPNAPDSAANAFFFNLTNNSAILDSEGFTVFGRVINPASLSIGGTNLANAGTNFLNFLNNTNIFNGNVDTPQSQVYSNSQFPTLPVNYPGINSPTDTNLFYVDFTFLSNSASGLAGPAVPLTHTNLPTAAVTSPAPSAVVLDGAPFVVQGTAADDVGVARVFCALFPQNGANAGVPFGANAVGTTNWSLDFISIIQSHTVPPGIYNIYAVSQDGAGNISTAIQQPVTVTAIEINGRGTVAVTNASTGGVTTSAIGAPLQAGVQYATRAIPAAGSQFLNWTGQGNVSITPTIKFQMAANLLETANFVSNNFPGSFAITSPQARQQVTNNDFMVTGSISGAGSAQVSYQLFSQSTGLSVGKSATVSNATSWSLPITNLATLEPGQYILQGLATDAAGHTTVVTNGFTLMAKVNLVTNGTGTISLSPSPNPSYPFLVPGSYTAKAVASKGSVFYNWSDGVNVSLNPVETFTTTANVTLTATFVSNNLPAGLAFTSPAANAKITAPSFTASGKAPASATNIMYQLFSTSSKLAVGPPMAASPGAQKWKVAVTNLAPGNYTAVAVAYDSQGRSTLITENFDLLAPLTVQFQGGTGTLSPNLNTQYLVVGQQYTMRVTPGKGLLFNGWSGGVSSTKNPLVFTMAPNLAVVANFLTNYFPNVAGTYYGLYYPSSEVSEGNSGAFNLTLNSSGVFSGSFTYSGTTVTIGGGFNPDGTQELVGTVGGVYFLVPMSLDLTNGTEALTGWITNASSTAINWVASLTAYRKVATLSSVTNFSSNAGKQSFVFTIDGDPNDISVPAGNGYATMSIASTGLITLGGTLADNTPFSQTVGLSKQGVWPLYARLYSSASGYKGAIFGWQTNTSPTSFSGSAGWIKSGISTATYYRGGFATNLYTSAGVFSAPAPGSQYVITIGGGSVAGTLTNLLTVSSAKQFLPQANSADKLKITLTTTTGVLNGQFYNPATGKTILLKGAFTSPADGGSGFTLDANGQTGYFQISLAQ